MKINTETLLIGGLVLIGGIIIFRKQVCMATDFNIPGLCTPDVVGQMSKCDVCSKLTDPVNKNECVTAFKC